MSEVTNANATVVTATVSYTIPDAHITTLLEMAGYGIAYWARSLNEIGSERVVEVIDREEGGHDGNTDHYRTTYGKLAEALVKLGTGQLVSAYSEYAEQYLSELTDEVDAPYADGNIDAALADHVVQYALFGTIIYG